MTKAMFINGSPRRNGNTAKLLNRAMEGAKDAGAEVEMVNLYDRDLVYKGCMSCFACKVKGVPTPPGIEVSGGGVFSIFSLWIFLFYTINYTCFLFSSIIVVISQNFSHQGFSRHIFNLYYKTQTICIAVIRFAIT